MKISINGIKPEKNQKDWPSEANPRKIGSNFIVERLGLLPVSLGLSLIHQQSPLEVEGKQVDISADRLKCFESGVTCVTCGLRAEYFAVEKVRVNDRPDQYTLCLYGIKVSYEQANSIEEIYFTKDHIIPSSRGGENVLANLQTMCWPCNSKKGNAQVRSKRSNPRT